MGKFFAGFILGSIFAFLITIHYFPSMDKSQALSKDTISIKFADQTFEVPDTTKRDSVR